MQGGAQTDAGTEAFAAARSKRRNLLELAVAYGLILLVIWTPRPLQRHLWWVAAASVAAIVCFSFDGVSRMGLRTANFLRSLWVVGVALGLTAIAITIAILLHTLHLPAPPARDLHPGKAPPNSFLLFIETYWAYSIWAAVQQFLLQCVFLSRLLRLLPTAQSAAAAAAVLFAIAHLPSPILTAVTLIWGFAACLIFLRYRNLYPLAIAHAIFGIAIAVTIPGRVDHNMRVGLGYVTYAHRLASVSRSSQPQ